MRRPPGGVRDREGEAIVKRLERSRTDRVLFGVCGGFGEYFGIDADVVRMLWILSVLLGGIGVIPYVAAILLMPESLAPQAPPREGIARTIGLALIALAIFFFLRLIPVPGFGIGVISLWSWRLLLPVVLLAGGALLVWPALRGATTFASERRITRSVGNRVLAGVAGGIAEATGSDANLVRIAFVLATTLTSGFAIVIYVILILVLREESIEPTYTAPAAPPPAAPPPPMPSDAPPPPPSPLASPPAPPPEAEAERLPADEKKRPEDASEGEADTDPDQEPTESDR